MQRDTILEAVKSQKNQIQALQSDIKKLRTHINEIQLPRWKSRINKAGKIPYLFLLLDGNTHDELKEIAHHLQQEKPGLYVLISNVDDKSIFLVSLADTLKDEISLKQLASLLKDKWGLRGGGSKILLQGGGGIVDTTIIENMEAWLQHQKA